MLLIVLLIEVEVRIIPENERQSLLQLPTNSDTVEKNIPTLFDVSIAVKKVRNFKNSS